MHKVIKNKKIVGSKVQLRQIESADLELLRRWRNESRSYFFDSSIISKSQQEKWFKNIYLKNDDDIIFTIETLKGNPVGFVSLYHINPAKKEAEYGRLIIANRYKGKGYAWDATLTLVRHAFTKLNLKQIRLEVIKDNKRAIGLYRKVGFKVIKNAPGSPKGIATMMLTSAAYSK